MRVIRKSAPGRHGPPKIRAVDDTGAAAKFQSQTIDVARQYKREKAGVRDAGEVDRNPASGRSDSLDGMLLVALRENQGGDRLFLRRGEGPNEAFSTSPRYKADVREINDSASPHSATGSVPTSLSPSVLAPSFTSVFGSAPTREFTPR